jgi:hypothetical protein
MAMPQTGAKAVADSQVQSNLAESVRSSTAEAPQLTLVANKAFVLRGGIWTDTTYDPETMHPQAISFGSAAYFELVGDHPECGKYLAVGEQVIVVLDNNAYQVGPGGASTSRPVRLPVPTTKWSFWSWLRDLLR